MGVINVKNKLLSYSYQNQKHISLQFTLIIHKYHNFDQVHLLMTNISVSNKYLFFYYIVLFFYNQKKPKPYYK